MQKHCSEGNGTGGSYRFMIKARPPVPNAFNVPLFVDGEKVDGALRMSPGTSIRPAGWSTQKAFIKE